MAERPAADKIPHSEVDYEHPSKHLIQHCGICKHFIRAKPPRCEAVKSPIESHDWCKRYERKHG